MSLTKQLHYCGANGPRVDYRQDPVSGLWLPGFRLEPERIQTCRYSRAHDSWSPWKVTIPTTNATAPDGSATADVIHEDATAASGHVVYSYTTVNPTAGVHYCCSSFVKAINRTFAWIGLYETVHPKMHQQWFDLVNLTVYGTPTFINRSGIEDWGGDWRRIWMELTQENTENTTAQVGPAAALGLAVWDGLNRDSIYVWGSQLEAGLYPSSHIINDGVASVTRTADSEAIWILGSEMARREWTLTVPVIVPTHIPAADTKLCYVFKNGAAATNHVSIWAESGTGKLKVTSACSGGSAGSLVVNKNICDGNMHWVSVHARNGQLYAIVDTQYSASDLDAGIASDLDRYAVCASGAWVGGCEMVPEFRQRQTRPVQPALMGG